MLIVLRYVLGMASRPTPRCTGTAYASDVTYAHESFSRVPSTCWIRRGGSEKPMIVSSNCQLCNFPFFSPFCSDATKKPEWLYIDTIELCFFITVLHHNSGLLFQQILFVNFFLLSVILTLLAVVIQPTRYAVLSFPGVGRAPTAGV